MLTAANVLRIAAAVIDAAEWSLDEDGRRLLVTLLAGQADVDQTTPSAVAWWEDWSARAGVPVPPVDERPEAMRLIARLIAEAAS